MASGQGASRAVPISTSESRVFREQVGKKLCIEQIQHPICDTKAHLPGGTYTRLISFGGSSLNIDYRIAAKWQNLRRRDSPNSARRPTSTDARPDRPEARTCSHRL